MNVRLLAIFMPILLQSAANAHPYDEPAQRIQEQQAANEEAQAIASLEERFGGLERQFMINLERFDDQYGPLTQIECSSQSPAGYGTHRACGTRLCVEVPGNRSEGLRRASSYRIFRSSEVIRGCKVVLRDGAPCSVSYLYPTNPYKAEIASFGGSCIYGNESRTIQVPFRDLKVKRTR